MTQGQSFVLWTVIAVLAGLAWVQDPWAPPAQRILAGVRGRPQVLRVFRGPQWVEYRQVEQGWYIHAYSRQPSEQHDPYRLAEVPSQAGPNYDGLVGDKDRAVRRLAGLNAMIADVLVFLAVKPCIRMFRPGELDVDEAGFAAGNLALAVTCGEQGMTTTVHFGRPSSLGRGFYFAVPSASRHGVVSATLVSLVSALLKRDFERAGQAAGRRQVRLEGRPASQ